MKTTKMEVAGADDFTRFAIGSKVDKAGVTKTVGQIDVDLGAETKAT